VEGLVTALLRCESTVDFSEYRYKEQLKGSIRVALLRTILLAEKMDYGRAKAFLDVHAELLLAWLCAEESVLLPPTPAASSAPNSLSSSSSFSSSSASSTEQGGGESSIPTPGALIKTEDAPVKACSTPKFGVITPHPGVELWAVRGCIVKLAAMFRSRVKTIPAPLLLAYSKKSKEVQQME